MKTLDEHSNPVRVESDPSEESEREEGLPDSEDWTGVVCDANMIVTWDFRHQLKLNGFDTIQICQSPKELAQFFAHGNDPDLLLLGDFQKFNGSSFHRVRKLLEGRADSPEVSRQIPLVSVGSIPIGEWNLSNPVMSLTKPLSESDFQAISQFTRSNAA